MSALARLAATKPLSVSVVAALVVIFGLYVVGDMDLDLLPDIQSPAVMVTLKAGNRPALEMEARFGQPIEQKLFTVRGLRSVEQVVRSGELIATVSLNWGADVDLALVEINQALANIATDRNVEALTVRRFDPRQMPVLVIGVRAKIDGIDLSELRRLALRELVPGIEKREGVAEVRVRGGREKQINIHVDAERLRALGLTLDQVASSVDAANADVNVGTLIDNNRVLQVQGSGRFASVEDVGEVIIHYFEGPDAQQIPIKVADFASIELSDARVTGMVRVDGREGLSLSVYKEGGANTIRASREIKAALAALRARYPQLHFAIIADDARLVENAIGEVEFAALVGMLLATAVLVAFLRSPVPILIVAVTIPVSILGTVSAMALAGFTLNLLTLGGLAIGIGLLVDNAIVVIESIYRRRRAGDAPLDAAVSGVKAVGGAIVSSTLTTCVVFVPVVFIDGLAAAFVSGIAFTVVMSLLVSLAAALLLIPALSVWLLPKAPVKDRQLKARHLQQVLGKLLDHPAWATGTTLALIAVAVVGLARLGTDILPPADAQQVMLEVQGSIGQSAQATARMVAQIERLMTETVGEELGPVLSEVGRLDRGEQMLLWRQAEENSAKIIAMLEGSHSGAASVIDRLTPRIAKLGEVEVNWQANTAGLSDILGLGAGDIVVEVTGPSMSAISQAAETLRQRLGEHPALSDVRTSLQGAPPQVLIELKPVAAAQRGLDLEQLTAFVEASLDGLPVTTLFNGDEQTNINIALSGIPYLGTGGVLPNFAELTFYTRKGLKVRLGDVAEITRLEGAQEISRRDQRRIVNISARAEQGYSLLEARAAVASVLQQTGHPWGVSAALAGDEQARKQNLQNFRWLGLLAVLLVYMVLTASFESLRHPLVILSVIPVTLIGIAATLVPLGQPVGIMAMLGFVILVGIAVNDAILLVHAARAFEAQGESLRQALLQAAQVRLRPIIMTTATTVLALLPLAVAGAGQLQAPLAWTVIGGVIASTLASLTVVPCVYLMVVRSTVEAKP